MLIRMIDTLNTNEIKNAAGAEQEFSVIKSNGTEKVWKLITEAPNRRHRLSVAATESGTGVNRIRNTKLAVSLEADGVVSGTVTQTLGYIVLRTPVGNQANSDAAKNVLANLMSCLASTGADTTIKYDCTGNGAVSLISGVC